MANQTLGGDITAWNPNFAAYNNTYIVWGTENIYPSGYIVISANEKARIEEIAIEQGAGFEAVVILLNKGLDVDITVVDDTSITPPTINSIVTLVTPLSTTNMLMIGSGADQARKREGQRTFTFRSYNAISGIH